MMQTKVHRALVDITALHSFWQNNFIFQGTTAAWTPQRHLSDQSAAAGTAEQRRKRGTWSRVSKRMLCVQGSLDDDGVRQIRLFQGQISVAELLSGEWCGQGKRGAVPLAARHKVVNIKDPETETQLLDQNLTASFPEISIFHKIPIRINDGAWEAPFKGKN